MQTEPTQTRVATDGLIVTRSDTNIYLQLDLNKSTKQNVCLKQNQIDTDCQLMVETDNNCPAN